MQVLITHGHAARTRLITVGRWQLALGAAALVALLAGVSVLAWHLPVLARARAGGPGVADGRAPLAVRDDAALRDRVLRENLDAMARKVGEMQAKLVRLEAVSERVSGLAGLKPDELQRLLAPPPAARTAASAAAAARPPARTEPGTASVPGVAPAGASAAGGPAAAASAAGGRGGPFVAAAAPSLAQLADWVGALDERADQRTDLFTLIESRLLESRLQSLLIPNSRPVDGPVGSGFGFRADPFTGRAALHTGLDFPAESGTAIGAAAGGVVVTEQVHPQYGRMLEVDHGRGLVTRYAHASQLLVRAGDLVRRGQVIARVGSTGRSTGAHLHFEVLVDGVPQDPARFLSGRRSDPAAAPARGRRAPPVPTVASADR